MKTSHGILHCMECENWENRIENNRKESKDKRL